MTDTNTETGIMSSVGIDNRSSKGGGEVSRWRQ